MKDSTKLLILTGIVVGTAAIVIYKTKKGKILPQTEQQQQNENDKAKPPTVLPTEKPQPVTREETNAKILNTAAVGIGTAELYSPGIIDTSLNTIYDVGSGIGQTVYYTTINGIPILASTGYRVLKSLGNLHPTL